METWSEQTENKAGMNGGQIKMDGEQMENEKQIENHVAESSFNYEFAILLYSHNWGE